MQEDRFCQQYFVRIIKTQIKTSFSKRSQLEVLWYYTPPFTANILEFFFFFK